MFVRVSSDTWLPKVRGIVFTYWVVENLSVLQSNVWNWFKITKVKIARCNKMLLSENKIRKIYSPCRLVSVVHLAYYIVLGVERRFPRLSSIDEVNGQRCFERSESWGRFLSEIRIHCSIFPSNAKKHCLFVLFSDRLGNIFLLSAWIRTIFASQLRSFQLSSAPCDHPSDYGTAWN